MDQILPLLVILKVGKLDDFHKAAVDQDCVIGISGSMADANSNL